MSIERDPEIVHEAWKSEPTQQLRVSPEEMTKGLAGIERAARNLFTQSIVASFFYPIFWVLVLVYFSQTFARIGAALSVLGWLLGISHIALHRRVTTKETERRAERPLVEFYRLALARERDFYRHSVDWRRPAAWPRFIAMLIGPVIFLFGIAQAKPRAVPVALGVAFVFLGLFPLGIASARRSARAYELQLDELNQCQENEP